ncbi:LysR family transcriptional regulator [Deinococcus roseus]|uniref:Transcriptional regulator n=1 Tax=Deinococcus roseus TaxID=392414 RepID=A0ABQ2D2L5_9DEIO|nr:LysR family transcriptional regulator [Deinococcus roseus]GGJ43427.1 transcriptional regulator [Deinococcus roseus]
MAPPRPTLSQLQCFVAVSDAGSFNEAAARTGMSQSSLSEAVQTLEKHLKCSLLHRSRSGITLTEAGSRALEHARIALLAVEDLTRAVEDPQELTGTVRIVSLRSVASKLLPPVLVRLRHDHPRLNVVVLESESHASAGEAMLMRGEADIGLLTHPPQASLLSWPIFHDEWLAIYARTRQQKPRSWQDYHGQNFLMNGGAPQTLVMIEDFFEQHGISDVRIQQFQDDTVLLAMAEHDLGITLLPGLAIPHLPDNLETSPLPAPLPRTISVLVLPRRSSLPTLQVVISALLEAYPPEQVRR